MPELPEVEITRQALSTLEGARLVSLRFSGKNLRRPYPPTVHLPGAVLQHVRRVGKCLMFCFESGLLVSHLGMSGRYRLPAPEDDTPPLPHDHAEFRFADGRRAVFHDPRRFGGFSDALPAGLGPEPFVADPEKLLQMCRNRNTPIKPLLLDQKFLAGVGNIYACEGLWRARLHPERSARSLSLADWQRLLQALAAVMTEAIAAGGSSFRDFASPAGKGYFQFNFSVYDRASAACTHCGNPIVRMVQAQRATFHCTGCAA